MNVSVYKPYIRSITQLAIPMSLSRLVVMVTLWIGFLMLARLGHDVLAASQLINAIQTTVVVTGMSVLFAIGVVAGRYYGEKRHREIGELLQQGFLLAIIISVPMGILLWFIEPILHALNQPVHLLPMVKAYFHAYVFGIVAVMLNTASFQCCYSMGKQQLALRVNILGLIVTVSLCYIMIFGKFGFPVLGVAGYAYGLAIANWLVFAVLCVYFYRHPDFQSLAIFKRREQYHWGHLKQLFTIGWPMVVQFSGELLAFSVVSIFTGWLGESALAAQQIVMQYGFLVIVPIFAISEAASILISRAHGAKEFAAIRPLGNLSTIIVGALLFVILLCYYLFPKFLASLYMDIYDPINAETLKLVIIAFAIRGFSQFFDGARHMATGSLRGLYDVRVPMYVGLVSMWVIFLPIAYGLAFHTSLGYVGILIGGAVGIGAGSVAVWYRWWRVSEKYLNKSAESF